MGRRSVYMYGTSLDNTPTGQVGCGLGMNISSGKSGLVQPTKNIKKTGIKHNIDGLDIIFQVTPGTEAPAEMNFHFPQYRALCMAENLTHTMHNIQTPHGALVRDARMWSRYLDEALVLFGNETDIVFASHHWPTFGYEKIIQFMSEQRDLYAYLYNETLRFLNAGQTCLEVAEDFVLPPSLDKLWNSRGYYGSTSHNVKAVYNRYMAWLDGNPAHLWEHPPQPAVKRYVQCIGGTGTDALDIFIQKGVEYRENGDLRFSATLLSHAVFADQTNQTARQELATTYQKLGYGAENATWRNIYLVGATELTSKITPSTLAMSVEALQALNDDQLTDTMAIRVEGAKAWDYNFTIDVMITDEIKEVQSGWHMNLSHGALTGHAIDYLAERAPLEGTTNLTIWPTRAEFIELVSGAKKNVEGIKYNGDPNIWVQLISTLVTLDTGFAIVTPEPVKDANWKSTDAAALRFCPS
ncbi:hypothetical protein HYALB_00003382 [Hymenoscyphus albidus]|uniref:Uncharacterized protein n=1 Tax=Hymenoscyphus albidus TaxID=595503 RepID=A0A9N9Q7V0_9HELO|nr:hypothetical protein HYALB_00003382 [Hymenoscyphus albidus]